MPKAEAVEAILELVRQGDHDAIDAIFGPPLTMLSRCLRSFFVAPPGKVLLSGDWSNVESRGAAWFAGEAWKLAAFRAQDNKTGPDVYRLGASRLLGIAVEEVTSEQRQAYGKVPDLAFQYQGGVGSGKVMGKTYGVKATDAEWNDRKEKWRAAHPRIVATWRQIQNAAINAVRTPGTAFACGYVGREAQFKTAGSFLWCRLPSGRVICFPYPKILEGEYGPQLTYMTVPDPAKPGKVIADPQNAARWARIATYGGALFNRVIQGFCRDFLADGMLDLDARGLMLVLHTHDDINGEIEEAKAERARALMQERMRTAPGWAKDFPLHADVKVMRRYGK
jgi:DNA polymerase